MEGYINLLVQGSYLKIEALSPVIILVETKFSQRSHQIMLSQLSRGRLFVVGKAVFDHLATDEASLLEILDNFIFHSWCPIVWFSDCVL